LVAKVARKAKLFDSTGSRMMRVGQSNSGGIHFTILPDKSESQRFGGGSCMISGYELETLQLALTAWAALPKIFTVHRKIKMRHSIFSIASEATSATRSLPLPPLPPYLWRRLRCS
jgi:hypothetical protein